MEFRCILTVDLRKMKKNSKKWKEVLALGCGGIWSETQDGREFDCENGYSCGCDSCPCCIVKQEENYNKENSNVFTS